MNIVKYFCNSNYFRSVKIAPLIILSLFSIFVFNAAFFNISCVDQGFHIRTGELVWQTRSIPSVNTFSSSNPGERWYLHQWLPALSYYLVFKASGITGLIIYKCILACIMFALVLAVSRHLAGSASIWPFWTASIGVLIGRSRFLERPYMFSEILLALLFLLLLRNSSKKTWMFIFFPLFMAFWANIHMGVVYGLAFYLIFLAGDIANEALRANVSAISPLATAEARSGLLSRSSSGYEDRVLAESGAANSAFIPRTECPGSSAKTDNIWRKLFDKDPSSGFRFKTGARDLFLSCVIILSAMTVSLQMINPNGIMVLIKPVIFFLDPFWKATIVELMPASGGELYMIRILFISIVILQSILWRSLDWRLILTTTAFFILAMQSQRAILQFTIIATPYLCFLLERLISVSGKEMRRLMQSILIPAWLYAIFYIFVPNPTYTYGIGLNKNLYPVHVLNFMHKNVKPQNIYNDMMYGGPILWFLYPEFKPFIDSRGEAYSLDFWKNTFYPISNGERTWSKFFSEYNVHGALINQPSMDPMRMITYELYNNTNWILVAFDNNALLFLEKNEDNSSTIERFGFRYMRPGDSTLSLPTDKFSISEAISEAEKALAISPDCFYSQTFYAKALMLDGNFEKALKLYSVLLKNKGTSPAFKRDYAYCLFRTGKISESVRIFQELSAVKGNDGFADFMLYFIAVEQGDTAGALTYINRAIDNQPTNTLYINAKRDLERTSGRNKNDVQP